MKVILDTNTIIDVLQNRAPWCEAGKKIFLAVATKQIDGCITAKELTDIYYLSRKQFKREENVDEKVRTVIARLLVLFNVLDTLAVDCQNALVFENNDYEDAVMIASAMRENIDAIITRDKSHFNSQTIKIYQPEEFVECFLKST